MSLSGRVAFVTGASQGIGRACALKLATAGAAVAVAARNQEKLNELVNEIAAAGGKAAAFALDVTDEEQVKASIKAPSHSSARSISWSTTPASPATSSSCA